MPRTPAQKLRDYLRKKYGDTRNIFIKRKAIRYVQVSDVQRKTRKNSFLWKSWFTGDELVICRECAYKETYGTKNMKKAKTERILEKKEINQ